MTTTFDIGQARKVTSTRDDEAGTFQVHVQGVEGETLHDETYGPQDVFVIGELLLLQGWWIADDYEDGVPVLTFHAPEGWPHAPGIGVDDEEVA